MLAGLFFSLVTTIGFLLCILPGIAVALVTPVFVNRIFVTDMGIGEAFSQSFQVVYRSENGLSFVGLEVLTGIVVGLLALVTCGLGGLCGDSNGQLLPSERRLSAWTVALIAQSLGQLLVLRRSSQ